MLVVIGNSGSGKSSLVRAGLIPALQRGRFCVDGKTVESWNIAVVQARQLIRSENWSIACRAIGAELSPADRDALITRWRETFPERWRCGAQWDSRGFDGSHGERCCSSINSKSCLRSRLNGSGRRYIDAVLRTTESDGVHLILGLRADFYANCLTHEALKPHLQRNYSLLLMKPDQLREAIEKRLALAGTRAEDGLTDALLADVGTEPGNLALAGARARAALGAEHREVCDSAA